MTRRLTEQECCHRNLVQVLPLSHASLPSFVLSVFTLQMQQGPAGSKIVGAKPRRDEFLGLCPGDARQSKMAIHIAALAMQAIPGLAASDDPVFQPTAVHGPEARPVKVIGGSGDAAARRDRIAFV
jgi:hypothetical protein